jgi:predicted acetyltransferase
VCFLTLPSEAYKESFLAGAAEFHAEGQFDSTYVAHLGYHLGELERRFDAFLRDLRAMGEIDPPPRSRHVDRVFWLIADDEYVGQASIRPELATSYLITYGGHIGYSIRPSRRRRGYGRRILALALDEARALGLNRVLVTCDCDNDPSRRIIEANGGWYESSLSLAPHLRRTPTALEKRRYWIELGQPLPA